MNLDATLDESSCHDVVFAYFQEKTQLGAPMQQTLAFQNTFNCPSLEFNHENCHLDNDELCIHLTPI